VLLHELTAADQFDGFASQAVSLIQKIKSSGPLVLAGHCYGGILAYEVAQQLIAAGHAGISLIIIETPAPGYPKIQLRRYLRHAPAAMRTFFSGSAHHLVNEIAGHVRFLRKRRSTPSVASAYVAPDLPGQLETSDPAVTPAGVVLRTYRPKPFTGKLACLNAGDAEISERVLEDPRLGWRDLSRGPFLSRKVTGEHDSMFEADNAEELAHHFQSVLRTLS
jgi:thioesterase domain-containing protein